MKPYDSFPYYFIYLFIFSLIILINSKVEYLVHINSWFVFSLIRIDVYILKKIFLAGIFLVFYMFGCFFSYRIAMNYNVLIFPLILCVCLIHLKYF